MKNFSKQIIAAALFSSFIAVAFFGLAFMTHGSDEKMASDCLFPAIGESLCPQDRTAVALHHMNAFRAFLNVTFGISFAALIISLLFVFRLALVAALGSHLLGPPLFVRISPLNSPPPRPSEKKLIRWLSLFENSPSLA